MNTVRDRLWIWGHEAGAHNGSWGLKDSSRMTPAEGAYYLGVPNMIMVRFAGQPSATLEQYHLPFLPLKRVVWSVVNDGKAADDDKQGDLDAVLRLAGRFPNITGLIIDDFFLGGPTPEGAISQCSLKGLETFRQRLHGAARPLDLWMVLYDHDLRRLPPNKVTQHAAPFDVVTFWTWEAGNLERLDDNLAAAQAVVPGKPIVLGCYLYDYGGKTPGPMPIERMEYQCRKGLEWLREGRIVGMIFLASCICDLDLEAVEYTRRWIAQTGDQVLG